MSEKYSGGIFSDSLEKRRSQVEIVVEDQEVIAETSSGIMFRFDYLETGVEIGGASGKMIFLRSKDGKNTLFCEDSGFQEELLQSSFAPLLEKLLDEKRARKRKFQVYGLYLLGFCGALIWGVFVLLGSLADYALGLIPPDLDEQFGKLAFESMDHGGSEVHEGVIVEPVQDIVNILEKAVQENKEQDWNFKVHVIDADIKNAYALPGGYIVVYTGLLEEMSRPEQLAGVLAHEMAHVTERHSVQRLVEMAGVAFVVDGLLGDVEGMVALGAEFLSFSTINAYSRDAETEADLKGVAFLQQANIDPRGLMEFFALLDQADGEMMEMVPEWMSTHPDHQIRIQTIENFLEKEFEKEKKPEDLTEKIAWKELKEHLD